MDRAELSLVCIMHHSSVKPMSYYSLRIGLKLQIVKNLANQTKQLQIRLTEFRNLNPICIRICIQYII